MPEKRTSRDPWSRRGGFRCPLYPACEFSDVIRPFIEDHVREAHPDYRDEGTGDD